jgi:hypothetical protein
MRTLPFLAALTLAVALAPQAQAQDSCSQASPCPWDLVVDSPGFIGEGEWNWTAGDWMRISVANDDDVAHTVTLSGYDLTFSIPALEERSQTVQLTKAGTFQFADQPSGDGVDVHVVQGDVVDYEKGISDANGNPVSSGSSGTGRVPGVELPLLVLGLAAAVLAARRSP